MNEKENSEKKRKKVKKMKKQKNHKSYRKTVFLEPKIKPRKNREKINISVQTSKIFESTYAHQT